jgi:hypothetical protein
MAQTLGEYRVGIDFNPSGNVEVATIKRMAAELIDKVDAIDGGGNPEVARLKALAITSIEDAAM